jgi:hypothetical protein
MKSSRRGALLLESAVSLTLLGALLLLAMPGLGRFRALQQASSDRAAALRGCSAALECVAALPWEKIDASAASDEAVLQAVQGNLAHAKLELEIAEEPMSAKRISTWRYRDAEASP